MNKEEKKEIAHTSEVFNAFFVERLAKEEPFFYDDSGYDYDEEEDVYCFFIDIDSHEEWLCSDENPLFEEMESVCRIGLFNHNVLDNPSYEEVYQKFKKSLQK